jgi:hypothetical protein
LYCGSFDAVDYHCFLLFVVRCCVPWCDLCAVLSVCSRRMWWCCCCCCLCCWLVLKGGFAGGDPSLLYLIKPLLLPFRALRVTLCCVSVFGVSCVCFRAVVSFVIVLCGLVGVSFCAFPVVLGLLLWCVLRCVIRTCCAR